MHFIRPVPIVLAAVGVLAGRPAAEAADLPAAPPTPVYYRLVLDGAMFSNGDPRQGREIVLDLEQVEDRWGAVYGVARSYNMAFHKGAIRDARVTPDGLALRISTDVTPDKWIPAAEGDYTVTLSRPTPETLRGTFTGTFSGVQVSGAATGLVYTPTRAPGFIPLGPQEHPRLLFRKVDLPALREKLKTPFGRAALSKMESAGTPTALGALYQLTSDKRWADRAVREAEEYLAGRKPPGNPFVPKAALWGQVEELAFVYDLCYDAAPDEFKARYRAWIGDLTFKTYFAAEALGVTNWHVVSNHVANVYSGITLGGLVLFDEPSPAPAAPSEPFLDEVLPPARDFKPASGVPVVAFTPGKSPTAWLHTELLRQATPDDPREVFYGLEKVHPVPGTKIQVGDFTLTFETMASDKIPEAEPGGLKLGHLIETTQKGRAKEPLTMCLYSVLEVTAPGTYVAVNPVTRSNLAQMALAGKLLADGQVVRLEKGYYPLMCLLQWRFRWPEISPRLDRADPQAIAAWKVKVEQARKQYQTRAQAYETVLAAWKRSSGGNPMYARMLRLGHFTSWLHCTDAVGKGGFQAEVGHYHMDACSGHAKLWTAWRNVMGFDLSPNMEYADFIPRKVVAGPQDINGTNEIGAGYCAWLFPSIRNAWKPEILAVWHAQAGVKSPGQEAHVLDADPVRAFLHYPLDRKPAPVGTKLPLVWEAPDLGYYAFRSGWDADAFIAQVFLKNQIINGWNGPNAGTYRLHGLGQDWACGTGDRVRRREQENVVILPEADLAGGLRGHLACFKPGDDRTLVLSLNLDEVYESDGLYACSKYGHLRVRNAVEGKDGKLPQPSGITGMRSLAFDYSGLSGAPCLFVVVDKIDGGGALKRTWLFQPPATQTKPERGAPVTVLHAKPIDRGFLVAPEKTKATLRGFFASPAAVNASIEPTQYAYVKSWGKGQGQKVTVPVHSIRVDGKDHFFFVGTVSSGDHPTVAVQGVGLDATVTVGRRTVQFDGSKVVLGLK